MFTLLMMMVAFALLGIKSVGLFYIMLLLSEIATFYLLRGMLTELLKFIVFMIASLAYRVKIINSTNLPTSGAVLLLGNHILWIDWILLQKATPRPIHFVMDRPMYNRWYLKPFFELFGAIPISPRGMKQAKLDNELSYEAWLEYSSTLPSLPQAWIESAKRYSSSNGFLTIIKAEESI